MALVEYTCQRCGDTQYVFDNEEMVSRCSHARDSILAMPPNASIVHATEIFMLTQLDSIHTIEEVDRLATLAAADEREAKQHQAARKEI